MDLIVGVDVGQRREPSAICAVEVEPRESAEREIDHYVVRHLARIPAGTSYPEIARHLRRVVDALVDRTGCHPEIFVDATGLGMPIVTLLRDEIPHCWPRPVYFTHGDRRSKENGEISLGKAFLVTRLQTLLQSGHLHLPRTPESETLARELLEYEVHVEPDANDRYGAFRVGRHDDLVTALGLTVQQPPARWGIT